MKNYCAHALSAMLATLSLVGVLMFTPAPAALAASSDLPTCSEHQCDGMQLSQTNCQEQAYAQDSLVIYGQSDPVPLPLGVLYHWIGPHCRAQWGSLWAFSWIPNPKFDTTLSASPKHGPIMIWSDQGKATSRLIGYRPGEGVTYQAGGDIRDANGTGGIAHYLSPFTP
jgi:hypothetical protein